ncbi:hypothetical protein H6F74_16410 [Trichocoleus sp. FACHB-90]|uniref:hypothetical protein n=1 Tax=Cyanophyceae TaxID=3028117 RepID=UPI0016868C54|nr:hypothetical protein [Trichocoleus sp. FACHB-90]MBD1927815.1 hypothetical protein [Trichocoleus sp. FACHB-90]
MARRTRRTRSKQATRNSFIKTRWFKRASLHITKAEAGQVLGVPANQVKWIKHMAHQLCIVWENEKGKTCSSFFSYRIFPSWQRLLIAAIQSCQNLEELNSLGAVIEYEFARFNYPTEMEDLISDILKSHHFVLKAAACC